jgi:MFS family permease
MDPLLPATAVNPSTTMTVDQMLELVSGKHFKTKLWLLTGMTQFADAMELLLLSFLSAEIRCPFHLSTNDITLLQTCVLVGMFIGSNLTGKYSDSFGRRPGVILSLILTVVGGLAATFATTFTMILIARFVVGLGVGSAPVALTLFTEFLPTTSASTSTSENRGRSLIIFFLFFSVGALFESLVAWATLSTFYRWRALLLVSALPSLLLLMVTPTWLPESPRWLIARSDGAEAMKVVRQVARANGLESALPSGEIHLVEETGDGGGNDLGPEWQGTGAEGGGSNTSTTITLSVLFFLMASLYYSIVLLGTAIVDEEGGGGGSSGGSGGSRHNDTRFCNGTMAPTHKTGDFVSLVVTNGAELPGLWVAYILLDRIGRKRTIQFFFAACSVFCMLLLLTTFTTSASSLWLTTVIVFGARGSALGFNQSLWIYTTLYYPTSMRTRGVGFTSSMARVGSLLAPIIVNQGGRAGGLRMIATLCVGLALGSLFVVSKFLPADVKQRERRSHILQF